jgi:hypothetical protein
MRHAARASVLASTPVRLATLAFSAVLPAVLLAPRPAAAIPYETFIDVSDQADLEDLLASNDITQDTYDELLDLLGRGVNLNTAERGELYALPNLTYDDVDKIIALRALNKGIIRDPADLVAAGALSQEKLLAIAAFIVFEPPGDDKLALRGWIRAMTRVTHTDRIAPPFMLRSRVNLLKHLEAGIALTSTRLRIGNPVYDPNRDALVAEDAALRVHVPKAFVKWESDEFVGIAGTYRAGFAQRLVFDNSSNYNPNGLYIDDEIFYAADLERDCNESAGELSASPCTGAAASQYVTPDFRWRNGLFGVGVGGKRLQLGDAGWLQGYAWASMARRNIYQYELVDRSKCEDPHDDDDDGCAAPTVYVRPEGNLLTPTTQFSFETLPNVFSERLAGANVAYFADRRNSVGATIYAANESNLVSGIDLDFQEWSRFPTGRTFGAAGANFSLGRDWLDVFGEAAVSYDKMPESPPADGGGGPAAVLRVTATRPKEELETVLRYYSTDFANPYARPISQSDEFDGQRARDELGVRVRYINSQKLVQLRALLDVWVPPSTLREQQDASGDMVRDTQPKLDAYVRADVRTSQELRLGLWVRYQDKDLTRGGHDQCFEVSTETSETGEPVPCGGRQMTTTARVRYIASKRASLTLQLDHQLLDDDSASETAFRQDLAAWIIALYNPTPDLRIRGRVRFLDEAISDNTYLERSIAAVVEVGQKLRERDTLRVRLDTKFWMDDRDATALRRPNPELQLWLSYEAKL